MTTRRFSTSCSARKMAQGGVPFSRATIRAICHRARRTSRLSASSGSTLTPTRCKWTASSGDRASCGRSGTRSVAGRHMANSLLRLQSRRVAHSTAPRDPAERREGTGSLGCAKHGLGIRRGCGLGLVARGNSPVVSTASLRPMPTQERAGVAHGQNNSRPSSCHGAACKDRAPSPQGERSLDLGHGRPLRIQTCTAWH